MVKSRSACVDVAYRSGPPPAHAPRIKSSVQGQARIHPGPVDAGDGGEGTAVSGIGGTQRPAERQSVLALIRGATDLAASYPDAPSCYRELVDLLANFTGLQGGHVVMLAGQAAPASPAERPRGTHLWWGSDPELCAQLNAVELKDEPDPADRTLVRMACAEGPLWAEDAGKSDGRFAQLPGGPVAAFVLPIIDSGQPAAVLELAGRPAHDPSPDLIEAAEVIGREVGKILGRVNHNQDETAYARRLEREIEAATTQLVAARNAAVAADRARTAFFAAVSHDLRTPVHGILVAADQLRGADPESEERLVSTIEDSAESLVERLDELLALAQPPAYENLHAVAAHVPEVLHHALSAYQRLYALDRDRVSVRLDGSLDQEVMLQKAGFLRVIDSLFAAAMLAPRQVEITLALEGNWLRVRTTGLGAPKGHTSWVLVDQAVSAVEGEISTSLDSSVVDIAIPATPTAHQRVGRGTRVLLVDDTAVTRQLGQALISSLGYDVDTADGARAALEALRQRPYGLVFMDIRMPDTDGLEATRAVRDGAAGAESAPVPIVALTAHAVAGAREEALMAGMDDFLTKPFSRKSLEPVLTRYVGPPVT